MIYLSGAVDLPLLALGRPDVGLMLNQRMGNVIPSGVKLGADNSCVRVAGGRVLPRADWEAKPWLYWLAELPQEQVLFAVLPDVLGDAVATLERSLPYVSAVHDLGLPAAFVLQDGATEDLVPWREVDAVFIGGSDSFKTSEQAYRLAALARASGLHTHMGRVNTASRMFACAQQRFDSCDGTWLAYGPDANRPSLLTALNMAAALKRTPGLFEDDSMGHELASMVGL